MKKSKKISLSLNKRIISNLEASKTKGGNPYPYTWNNPNECGSYEICYSGDPCYGPTDLPSQCNCL